MEKNKNEFISNFKNRIIFPFYIDKINNVFFNVNKTQNLKIVNKILPKLKEAMADDEIKKIFDTYNLLESSKVQKILNNSINKISKILGKNFHDIFYFSDQKKIEEGFFIEEKHDINDFSAIGNIYKNKRYNFSLNLNKNNYLFNIAEQIQLSFYLDEKNMMVSGAVSFNWGKISSKLYDFSKIYERTYLINLIKVFIQDELKYISLSNIIDLIDNKITFDKSNSINKNKVVNTKKNSKHNTIFELKHNWTKFINKKFLNFKKFDEKEILYYENELFYSVLVLITISLIIYEDFKLYLSSSAPQLILSVIDNEKTNSLQDYNVNNEKILTEEIFLQLIQFSKKSFFNFYKFKTNEIKTAHDAINASIAFKEIDKESFGYPIISYEFTRNTDIPFLDQNEDIFLNIDKFKVLFLVILNPKLFGLNDSKYNLIEYDEYYDLVNNLVINKDWEESIKKNINKYVCEWNYNYASFINDDLSFLIIKNNNALNMSTNKKESKNDYEYDLNRKLYNNYLWAQIFTQTRIWKIKDLEEKFYINKNKYPFLLRGYISKLNGLYFDWNDNFYGIPEIKTIIKKINNISNLKNTILLLNKKFNSADHIYGKSKERTYLGLALMTASLFGFADFFTMVFTVLTVQNSSLGVNSTSITFISLGAILVFILLSILLYTIIKPIVQKRKFKIIEEK